MPPRVKVRAETPLPHISFGSESLLMPSLNRISSMNVSLPLRTSICRTGTTPLKPSIGPDNGLAFHASRSASPCLSGSRT